MGMVYFVKDGRVMGWPKGQKFSQEHIAKRSASLVASGKKRKVPAILDGVEYWKCGACNIYKPASEYYEDGKTASGMASVCKPCHIECSMRTRDKDNARELNTAHMKRARLSNPEKFRERERNAGTKKRQNSPEKVSARNTVNAAVKRGDLIKPQACEECHQEKKLTGHHEDYSMPLVVQWLCYMCHGKKHRVIEFKKEIACQ
jgi:hypothetical protein